VARGLESMLDAMYDGMLDATFDGMLDGIAVPGRK
jgi:hypothetical protein